MVVTHRDPIDNSKSRTQEPSVVINVVARSVPVWRPGAPNSLISFEPGIWLHLRAATDNCSACRYHPIQHAEGVFAVHPMQSAPYRYQMERPEALRQVFQAPFDQSYLNACLVRRGPSSADHARFRIHADAQAYIRAKSDRQEPWPTPGIQKPHV